MMFLVAAIIMFIVSVGFHILLHHLLRLYKRKTFKTVGIFGIGLILLICVIYLLFPIALLDGSDYWRQPFPMSSLFLYSLLSLSYIIYIASPYLGDEGPTAKVLTLLKEKRLLTQADIVHAFNTDEVILKRIGDLLSTGWIIERNKQYLVTPKGNVIVQLVRGYRHLFHISEGG